MQSPRKSELHARRLHYDEVYKNKRLKLIRDKFRPINFLIFYGYINKINKIPHNYISNIEFFKDPDRYLEFLKEKIETYNDKLKDDRFKKHILNKLNIEYDYFRKMRGKCNKRTDSYFFYDDWFKYMRNKNIKRNNKYIFRKEIEDYYKIEEEE